MIIVTPSFRLELTPVAGAVEAPPGARREAGSEGGAAGATRDMLDAAAGAVVAMALGTGSAPPGGAADEAPGVAGGWVRVRVRAGICGFRADFEARTQRESLRRFERALGAMQMQMQMQEGTARANRAELACDEPGIDLRLEAREAGSITGHFALESERRGGAWTTLSGTFELDPEALPAIRESILALLEALDA